MKRGKWALGAMCVLCTHCPRKDPLPIDAGGDPPVVTSAPLAVALDANAMPESCTLGHLGVLLDLPRGDVEAVEREGASWGKIATQKIVLHFAGPVDPPKEPIAVDVRARGGAAKRMTFTLNGKLLGDVGLTKNEAKVLHAQTSSGAPLSSGHNELVIRFLGLPRQNTEAAAEIDWIHIGSAEEGTAYVAPTHAEALGTQTIASVPRRGYAVRGPGFLRCTGALPEHGTFEAQIGMLGDGEADVEARILRDRNAPMVLGRTHVRGGEWKPMTFGVDLPARTLGAMELSVMQATPGARVVLAEAKLLTKEASKEAPVTSAKNVVLVVFGSLSPRAIAPYGGGIQTPELASIADAGMLFEAHRAASTWPSSSVASMLTGLSPRAHGVGERSGLDASIVTVADAAKQGGITTAFFTANPTTTTDYGFARPFSTFLAAMPGNGSSSGVFDEAARFFRDHASSRLLVVVHARGAHPPWDPSAEDLKKLPPDNYTGPVDPQHAGEILSRARRSPPGIHLSEGDRTRALALQANAIVTQDAAFGKLLAAIRETNHEKDTLVIATSDVGLADKAFLSDGDSLGEAELAIPLLVRGPDIPPKTRATHATTSADLARTILFGLGLKPPATFEGADIRATSIQPRALLSSIGERWSLRLLSFVLSADPRGSALCDLLADPGCGTDAQTQNPIAMEILHRTDVGKMRKVDPAYPSAATITALRAWGR